MSRSHPAFDGWLQDEFGDELFSLTPAYLACYTYRMVDRQETPRSPRSPAIERGPLASETIFDGTKLPMVVKPS
jgi:hypothetical protein